jgi:hypothetical protein
MISRFECVSGALFSKPAERRPNTAPPSDSAAPFRTSIHEPLAPSARAQTSLGESAVKAIPLHDPFEKFDPSSFGPVRRDELSHFGRPRRSRRVQISGLLIAFKPI